MLPSAHTVAELLFAHAKVRSAAFQVHSVSDGIPELEKLAGELMTMAAVTEIVAHALADQTAEHVDNSLCLNARKPVQRSVKDCLHPA